jgi:hypothetical protein
MGQAERPTCPDCGAYLVLAQQQGSVSMIETISPDLSLTNDIPDRDRHRR